MGFNNLFAQWLNEKLNQEIGISCTIWNFHSSEKIISTEQVKKIIIRQIRNRNEINSIQEDCCEINNVSIIAWWNGEYLPEEDIIRAINLGVSAVLSDRQEWNEIIKAIMEVNENGFHHNELVSEALYNYCKRNRVLRAQIQSPANSLGTREKKIIELRCSGKTSKEIGEILFLSKKTIDKIFGDLYKRFNCNNFFELLSVCKITSETN